MAKAISKPKSSTTKKKEVGGGHLEPVEQGEQGRSLEPVVVEPVVVEPYEKTIDELRLEGEDYHLTSMIYGDEPVREPRPTDVLPDADGRTIDVKDPLQLFVNLYQPSEVVTKNRFRSLLLTVLNDWKNNG
jgi:hypothetical protein